MEYLFVVAGLFALFFGGGWLVQGAIALAARLGLPAFLISLTVVGFGTSMPELLVSVRAALADAPGIAIGNVVGSNIANILLIIGLAAVISPISQTSANSMRDLVVMVLSAAFLVLVMFSGTVGPASGLVMIAALVAYLVLAWFQDRKIGAGDIDPDLTSKSSLAVFVLLAGGLALLMAGAELLVRGATEVATGLGVSNAVIGLTVVAVGTSLPELATSVAAALKRQADVALGNIIGSNIFNILGILGITAIIAPIPVASRFTDIDGWVMLAVTTALVALLLAGRGINRLSGGVLLAAYAGYMITMGQA